MHPCEVKSLNQLELLDFLNSCKLPKVVGIGETGLDLFRSNDNLKEQIKFLNITYEASIDLNLTFDYSSKKFRK